VIGSFKIKPQIAVDAYKLNHKSMYPKGTTQIYSNMTPRSGKIIEKIIPYQVYDGKVVHFGLQGTIKNLIKLFDEEFFNKPLEEVIAGYSSVVRPFTEGLADYTGLEELHRLGYLPIEIRGIPEGEVVPYKVPVFTVKNTHPDFAWLTNYLETYLSNEYWKPATVATIARYYRKIFKHFAEKTGAPSEFVSWQGHDFSCRGMSGMMDSAMSGAGHLTSFLGSDTVISTDYLRENYNADSELIAASVPASEHSVSSANILFNMKKFGVDRTEAEYLFFKDYVTKVVPNGIVSYVADTYDYWQLLTEIAPRAKDLILNRGTDSLGNSKVVFRPDSGDPLEMICGKGVITFRDFQELEWHCNLLTINERSFESCGPFIFSDVVKIQDKYYKVSLALNSSMRSNSRVTVSYKEVDPPPEVKGSIQCLWEIFGGTINEKGFKVLNSKVGLIYGDSITPQRAWDILEKLTEQGFETSCIVFGIGSYTYQYITRDTLGFAIKATYLECDGLNINLYKDPKTGDGFKKSAKGLLQVIKDASTGEYVLKDQVQAAEERDSCLEVVCRDSLLVGETSLASIRKNVTNSI
jgi:nicotinamide phosphoribosyltransferase